MNVYKTCTENNAELLEQTQVLLWTKTYDPCTRIEKYILKNMPICEKNKCLHLIADKNIWSMYKDTKIYWSVYHLWNKTSAYILILLNAV